MTKDLVCGMRIDLARSAGVSRHEGKTFHFCSNSCKAKFDREPAKYSK